jgi:hypothetical protein
MMTVETGNRQQSRDNLQGDCSRSWDLAMMRKTPRTTQATREHPKAVNTVEIGHGLRNGGSFPEVPSSGKIVAQIGITQGGYQEDWDQPWSFAVSAWFYPLDQQGMHMTPGIVGLVTGCSR